MTPYRASWRPKAVTEPHRAPAERVRQHGGVTTYIALVRGINVGGRAKVAMDDLRRLFVDLGHVDVRSYIQSGNVVFRSTQRSPEKLIAGIEAGLADQLGVPATVVLRTEKELAAVRAANPFVAAGHDPSRLYVAFLAATPAAAQAEELAVPAGESAEFSVAGQDVYLHYPDGYGRTKLNNTYIEKRLGVRATTRNWNTVTKLHDLAAS